jgi:hypothetical protein
VLKEIQKPEEVRVVNSEGDAILYHLKTPKTPKTFENLASLRKNVEMSLRRQEVLDTYTKLSIQKIADAAENAFAKRAILLDKNLLLFEQNNEKATCTLIKATVVGTAKVMSYEDIVEAQQKRDMKDAETVAVRGRRTKRNRALSKIIGKRTRSREQDEAVEEIRALGMEEYCFVLKF